ncbi:MAG: MotA/TolQ/ExbB proton channel family protein [Planctomycetota bacterium]
MTLLYRNSGLNLLIAFFVCILIVTQTGSALTIQESGWETNPETGQPAQSFSDSVTPEATDSSETSGKENSVLAARRILDIIRNGGPLMIPIGICSFILVVFIFERFISLRKSRIIPAPFTNKFLEQLREGELNQSGAETICERNQSAMAEVFKAGVMRWGRPAVEIEQAVLDEGERTSYRLRKYLKLINGVATVCPLLGLLGTVLGMIQAFDSIAFVGNSSGDPKAMIATGISQALLTTAAGLSVAIPALIAYMVFSSRVDKHVMEIDSLGMKVVNLISAETLDTKPATTRSKNKKAA